MSVLFQTVINTGRLYSFRKTLNASLSSCKCLSVRKCSGVPRKFVTFDEVVAQRRAEAKRSVVVQVNSESSFSELYGYCSKYASINGIHHYKNSGDEHFMLIEFSTEENLKEVLQNCSAHQKDLDVMALQSPFLWFRAVSGKKKDTTKIPNTSLLTKHGTDPVDEEKLFEELVTCSTVSDQIQLLYDRTTLNDLGVRLRYMVARQLEIILESLYANIAVRPFGSSVNGFGRIGCDLDLVLTNVLTKDMWRHCDCVLLIPPTRVLSVNYQDLSSGERHMSCNRLLWAVDDMLQSEPNKRLVYQEKKCEGGRSPWQRHMELMGELIELRIPGAARVQRILHARVPIVKYAHELVGVDCDLCYSNISGVYMSELLWLYGSLDARVRPLTFVVRRWAQTVGLTNPHPGRWITNFPLTLMVLFFLQQKSKEGFVLPSLKYLIKKAEIEDTRTAEDNLNCTFLRDLNKLPPDSYSTNLSDLHTLLLQFFEFYSQFDFQEKAISINEGTPVRKPNALPLYIVNPLEQALNVSRNVSFEECERLKMEVRNAAWQLESCLEGEKRDDWGLLKLIEQRSTRNLKKLLRVGNSHRLISVKDLFNDKEEAHDEGLTSKLKRLTKRTNEDVELSVKEMRDAMSKEKKEPTKFKNNQVASEVYRIRRNKFV